MTDNTKTEAETRPTDLDPQGLRKLLEKATPGPWEWDGGVQIVDAARPHMRVCFMPSDNKRYACGDANAALIVALVNAAPALIAAAEREGRLRALLLEAENAGVLVGVNQECCGIGVSGSVSAPECCGSPIDLGDRVRKALEQP